MKKTENLAFIDGQNLYSGVRDEGWKIDFKKFRVYLKDKYNISEAYYFMGFINESEQSLYSNLQKSGFIVIFKVHTSSLAGDKKGNVDTDIVFEVMKNLVENKNLNKILLVSGDGDYKKMVDYLVLKGKFLKILFPNKKFASSLYKKLGGEKIDYLSNLKKNIERKLK